LPIADPQCRLCPLQAGIQ